MDYNTQGKPPILAGHVESRQSPIAEAFTQLDRQIDLLGKNVEELTIRLQMILIEDREPGTTDAPRPMLPVPLANEILARGEMLSKLNLALIVLHKRLGL